MVYTRKIRSPFEIEMSDSDEFYDACEEESSTPARKAIVEQELAKSPRPSLAVEAKEIEGVEKAMTILSNKVREVHGAKSISL